MTDTPVITTTPETQPQPELPPIKRGLFNKRYLNALDQTESVILTAQKADYQGRLAESEIDDAFVAQLAADLADCRKRIAKAGDLISDLRVATAAEARAKKALLTTLKVLQAAAKQKFARRTPPAVEGLLRGRGHRLQPPADPARDR